MKPPEKGYRSAGDAQSFASFALFTASLLSYVSRRLITSLYSERRLRFHSVCAEPSAVDARISRSDVPRLRYAAYFFSSFTSCSSSVTDLSWNFPLTFSLAPDILRIRPNLVPPNGVERPKALNHFWSLFCFRPNTAVYLPITMRPNCGSLSPRF